MSGVSGGKLCFLFLFSLPFTYECVLILFSPIFSILLIFIFILLFSYSICFYLLVLLHFYFHIYLWIHFQPIKTIMEYKVLLFEY